MDQQPALNISFKSEAQVESYANQNNKVLVILDDYVLDATSFSHHHPGGAGLIHNFKSKKIDDPMKFHRPLSLVMASSMAIGSFKKDVERLIDPSKAILPQVWEMKHETYLQIVNSPHWLFVPSPRLFETDFFEFFAHNKWYSIFLLPALLISYMMMYIVPSDSWETANPIRLLIISLLGIFTFSLAEYLLHRYLFHSEKHLLDNATIRVLHFLLHGIHHMLPNDPDRLVFPQPLAVLMWTLGYFTVGQVFYFNSTIETIFYWTFFFVGYLIYDCCHYALHHIDTSKNPSGYFHFLQKYHNQHHYGNEEAGFGVSSKFWDIIFRTEFKEKKAKH